MDDRHRLAVGVIVERLIFDAALRAIEDGLIGWEDFPDIGEYDWHRVISEAISECNDGIVGGESGFDSAYRYLTAQANREM